MRVVCDNCGASYKIPDSKLTKEVNKATCRKCGHAIFIKRAGEEEARTVATPPSPHGEERTLITSAADLERAVRARAGSGYDEPADQRPTTVSLDHHGEATVPREPLAPAAFPPPNPFVPASPAFPLPPALARPAHVQAPPPSAPPRPAPISPSAQLTAFPPPPAPARPAFAPPAAALPPPDAAGPVSPLGAFDPRTDLSMALVALLVTVLGVLVLALSSWFQSPVVTGLGAFLALFGTFVVALILVTGGRGTRAASLSISFMGGLLLSGAFGAIVGTGLFFLTPEPSSVPMAAVTPPAVVPAVPEPLAALVEPPAAAVVVPVEPPPAEPIAVVAPAEPPLAEPAEATPPAATSSSKPTSTSTASNSKATSSKSSSASTAAETPERITPKATSSTSTPSTSTATSQTSSGSSASSTSGASTRSSPSTSTASSASAAASGVSPMVIDTMIKSNKGVKSCFVQQRNETGELPRGVKVKLTIQTSGKVSSAGLPSGDLQGSTFDSCLSSAVKSIQFPSFDGDPVTVTYPFSI